MEDNISIIRKHISALIEHNQCPSALLIVGSTQGARVEFAEWFMQALGISDVIRLESGNEAGSALSVDDIRAVLSRLSRSTFDGDPRIVYCSQAGSLTGNAGAALLKCLEEPPPSTQFILAAQSYQSVLPTLVSRCQMIRLPFVSLPAADYSWRALLSAPLWQRMVAQDASDTDVNLDQIECALHAGFRDASGRAELQALARIADTVRLLRTSTSGESSRCASDRIALASV